MKKSGIKSMAGLGRWAVAIAVWCACLLGCGDNGTGPQPPAEKDYRVYFKDNGVQESQYFAFHTLTGQVDTLNIDFDPDAVPTVSADGKFLYLAGSKTIGVVDLATGKVVSELSHGASRVIVSPDGRLIAFSSDSLYVCNANDLTTLFTIDTTAALMAFSRDSRFLYGLSYSGDTASFLVNLNLNDTGISFHRLPSAVASHLRPIAGDSLFCYYEDRGTCLERFVVFDLTNDSILFSDMLVSGGGTAQTPDGRYVFYTEPLNPSGCWPHPEILRVYDVQLNRVARIIDTRCVNPDLPDCDRHTFWLNSLCVTPDGRWVVGSPLGAYIIVIDLHSWLVTENIYLENGEWLGDATCQQRP